MKAFKVFSLLLAFFSVKSQYHTVCLGRFIQVLSS